MRKWTLALALCLLLTACSGGEKADAPSSLLGGAADVEEDAVLLTVDGREVPAWRYLYWLARTCDYLQERYEAAGLTLDWSAPLEGGTLADYAKDQALANTVLYAAVENRAEAEGLSLTEGDMAALAAAWEETAEDAGGEEAYLSDLAALGLDRARADELSGTGRLYAKLYARYESAEAASWETGEGPLTVNRILVAAGENRDAAREKAAEIFSQLNRAEDAAEVFASLAAQGDDPAGPRAVSGSGLDPSLEDAASALEMGQYSGILESGEGFSILMRCEADAGEVMAERFDAQLQQAAEEAVVQTTEAYDRLEAGDFAAGLRRGRRAL